MRELSLRSDATPCQSVVTRLEFSASVERVWQCLMFYEDVPRRPWPLLRLLLPQPLRSEGDKLQLGSRIVCTYDGGHLVKCITRVQPAKYLGFEVLEQSLGIERRARAVRGSYELQATAAGTRVLLTTEYQAHLRPRFLWRPLERVLCHSLHRHILLGMAERLEAENRRLPEVSEKKQPGTVAAPGR